MNYLGGRRSRPRFHLNELVLGGEAVKNDKSKQPFEKMAREARRKFVTLFFHLNELVLATAEPRCEVEMNMRALKDIFARK